MLTLETARETLKSRSSTRWTVTGASQVGCGRVGRLRTDLKNQDNYSEHSGEMR
jgi:hypothetical protein